MICKTDLQNDWKWVESANQRATLRRIILKSSLSGNMKKSAFQTKIDNAGSKT